MGASASPGVGRAQGSEDMRGRSVLLLFLTLSTVSLAAELSVGRRAGGAVAAQGSFSWGGSSNTAGNDEALYGVAEDVEALDDSQELGEADASRSLQAKGKKKGRVKKAKRSMTKAVANQVNTVKRTMAKTKSTIASTALKVPTKGAKNSDMRALAIEAKKYADNWVKCTGTKLDCDQCSGRVCPVKNGITCNSWWGIKGTSVTSKCMCETMKNCWSKEKKGAKKEAKKGGKGRRRKRELGQAGPKKKEKKAAKKEKKAAKKAAKGGKKAK